MNLNPRSYRVPVLRLTDVYQGDTVNGDPASDDYFDENAKGETKQNQSQPGNDAGSVPTAPAVPTTPPIRTSTDYIPEEPTPKKKDEEEKDDYIQEPTLDASTLVYTPTTPQKNPEQKTATPSVPPPIPPKEQVVPPTAPAPPKAGDFAPSKPKQEQSADVTLVPSPWLISPSKTGAEVVASTRKPEESREQIPQKPKPVVAPLEKPKDPFAQVTAPDLPDIWESASEQKKVGTDVRTADLPATQKKDVVPKKETPVVEKNASKTQSRINELLANLSGKKEETQEVPKDHVPETQHARALASVAQKLHSIQDAEGLTPEEPADAPGAPLVPKPPQERTYGSFKENDLVVKQVQEDQPRRAVPILRTYKNDIENVITHNKVSVVKMISDEEEKRHKPKEQTEVRRTKKRHINIRVYGIVLGGIGLLAATVALGFFVAGLLIERQREATTSEIFFSDAGREFDSTSKDRTAILKGLTDLRDTLSINLNETVEVRIIERVAVPGSDQEQRVAMTARAFLQAIDARASDFLLRTLYDDFIFGFYRDDTGKRNPFLIFKVRTYEIAFPGMLDWETGLDADLAPLFGTAVSRDLLARSAQENTGGMGSSDFLDIAQVGLYDDVDIANQAVRALRNLDGDIQLLWTIVPGSNMLIITTTPDTFREVRKRTQL